MNPPMRMLILLAVFWVAGSLLLAAEAPSTPKPAPAAKTDTAQTDTDKADPAKSAAQAQSADKSGAQEDKDKEDKDKKDDKGSKRSISEQAEEALKAANEATGGAKEPPKGDDKSAGEEAPPPNGSAGKGPSPQRFVPSEQVRADFDVSFPIDI